MSVLNGKKFELIIFVLTCLFFYASILLAKRGRLPSFRSIPALNAIEEAVGRASEMGKPIHVSTGIGGLHDESAPMTMAGLSLLGEVALKCGESGVPLRYTCTKSYMIPVTEDIIRGGYMKGRSPETFSRDMVVYTGEDQRAYQASVMGYLMGERPAANITFGAIFAEMIQTLGAGSVAGCIQIAGTGRTYYLPFMICTCDYCMLGEELFAASAIVSGEPGQLGTIRGQDLSKLLIIALLIASIILTTAGTTLFRALLSW